MQKSIHCLFRFLQLRRVRRLLSKLHEYSILFEFLHLFQKMKICLLRCTKAAALKHCLMSLSATKMFLRIERIER